MAGLQQFYSTRDENQRLLQGLGLLESVRTREILTKLLAAPPAIVYDVGGGTGHYAGWLTERGYSVHLLDPVPKHVARAASDNSRLASAVVGDARALPWRNQTADALLLMGPLYHLTERSDRVQTLREARRVLQSDGLLFAVIIPRWASALIGMIRGWTNDLNYAQMVREELTTGKHMRPSSWPGLFMSGFFHSQEDIEAEVAESGLELLHFVAIEGPAWMWHNFDEAWASPSTRAAILGIARQAETDPTVFATSPHVGIIARPAA